MILVAPVLAQILLTLVVLVMLGRARVAALKAGKVRMSEIAVSSTSWPEDVRRIQANVSNQFETPVLFYVLCGVATFTGAANLFTAVCAWLYVASRLAHLLVHTGSNNVINRFRIFLFGVVALLAMWLFIVVHLVIR
jgi:hypothetical protein